LSVLEWQQPYGYSGSFKFRSYGYAGSFNFRSNCLRRPQGSAVCYRLL